MSLGAADERVVEDHVLPIAAVSGSGFCCHAKFLVVGRVGSGA
jgi:hypothetical protein